MMLSQVETVVLSRNVWGETQMGVLQRIKGQGCPAVRRSGSRPLTRWSRICQPSSAVATPSLDPSLPCYWQCLHAVAELAGGCNMVWGHQHWQHRCGMAGHVKSPLSPSLWLQGISTCNTLAHSHLQPRKAGCKANWSYKSLQSALRNI